MRDSTYSNKKFLMQFIQSLDESEAGKMLSVLEAISKKQDEQKGQSEQHAQKR